MQEEIWKDIVGYEGYYQVSSHGRIKSLERYVKHVFGERINKERIRKQAIGNSGYYFVPLSKFGINKSKDIHRLVAIHFVDGYNEGLIVNHKDGNRLNNYYENLEWVTPRENNLHSFRVLGRKQPCRKGKNNPMFGKKHTQQTKDKISFKNTKKP